MTQHKITVQNNAKNTIFFFMGAEHRTNCNQVQCVVITLCSFLHKIKAMTHCDSKGLCTSVFSSYVLSHTRRILTRRYEKEKAH